MSVAVTYERIEVCDMCGARDDLVTYRIGSGGGRPRRVDLCVKHRKPVEAILEKSRETVPRRSPRPQRVKVMDPEVYKRAKKKGK